MTAVLWLRRDLRLADHPALAAAAQDGRVLPVFVQDPTLGAAPGPLLAASLAALHEATDGALIMRSGSPPEVIDEVAAQVGANRVHVTAEITPHGRSREARVAARLGLRGVALVRSGTAYAVPPGTLGTRAGRPFQVFSAFARAWRDQGAPPPLTVVPVRWLHGPAGEALPNVGAARAVRSGEAIAQARWREFLDQDMARYAQERDRPDLDTTSRMSAHLAMGEVHPRTLLADLDAHPEAGGEGARSYINELCWREFCADVLWHHPSSAWSDLRTDTVDLVHEPPGPQLQAWSDLRTDTVDLVHEPPGPQLQAWWAGRTGYPLVDAGMRQLLAQGWMHNRVRMVTASFLVKDLHVRWQVGARHFLDHLDDADLASNNLNWQWMAGTGTDAAPYFRIFNPVRQGLRFDPDGSYVRRWVPELAHLPGSAAQEPWRHEDGYVLGYPERIVDHDLERREALARYQLARVGVMAHNGTLERA